MKTKKICLIGLISLLFSHSLWAQQDASDDRHNQTKITVDLGFVVLNSTSTLNTDSKDEIKDNTKEGEALNSEMGLPLFDFQYIFRETDTGLFFGTPLDGSDLSLSLGVSQQLGNLGKLKLSFASSPGAEVWKNPYLENTEREKTPIDRLTTRFAWEKILNSSFNMSYSHIHSDVDEDDIGEFYEDLKRDGRTESIKLTYDAGLSRTSMISPGLLLEKSQLEGSANSYDKAGMSVKYQKIDRDYYFMLEMAANTTVFDKEHPIFKETREDREAGLFAMLSLLNLFEVEAMHSNFIIGASIVDSNLDFFDSRIYYQAVTLGYSF